MARKKALSASSGFRPRRDLPNQNVAGADSAPIVDDAGFVEVLRDLPRRRIGAGGDFLRAGHLVVAGLNSNSSDMDRGEDVSSRFRGGRIEWALFLKLLPFHGHERDQHVAAERELDEIGGGPSACVALAHEIAHLHQAVKLVAAGRLVGSAVFHQAVDIDARLVGSSSSVGG